MTDRAEPTRMPLRVGLMLGAALLSGSAATACGIFFPWQLLGHRDATLRDLPVDSFDVEAGRLVARPDPRLPPDRDWSVDRKLPPDTTSEEARTLTAQQRTLVAAMRASPDAASADAAGQGLPNSVRAYVAGAVAFAHDDPADAVRRFRAVLSAPPAQPDRTLWARYMLGRALADTGDAAGAAEAFRQTRAQVAAGAPDPLGLAVASFGEQARPPLQASRLPLQPNDPSAHPNDPPPHPSGLPPNPNDPPHPSAPPPNPDDSLHPSDPPHTNDPPPHPNDPPEHPNVPPSQPNDPPASPPTAARLSALHQAVRLYAEQASYLSQSGQDSLKQIAEALLTNAPGRAAWLAAAVQDPLLRHLLVAYVLAASGAAPIEGDYNDTGADVLSYDGQLFGAVDGREAATSVLQRLTPMLDTGGLAGEDAGRLAAVTYLRGDYDLSRRFAAAATGPLGAWIAAKLALQAFDRPAAIHAYDAAVRALAANPEAMTPQAGSRLRAEPAVLAVGRGDFEQALAILYPEAGDFWGDVAWLAERVLTTDELQRFVAARVPAVELTPRQPPVDWSDRSSKPARILRELLARRLMRDGRVSEATALFTSEDHRQWAQAYEQALHRSRHAFWRTDRARGAWDAAVIQRVHGMELFGTELQPDMAALDGAFDSGLGPDAMPSGIDATVEEQRRADASGARPGLRFHYRYLAVAQAERAAADLPPRSQAYAAVLCGAARWMGWSNDGPEAQRLYKLYVAHGAAGPFAARFGDVCPAPDFAAAARLRWTAGPRHALGPALRHPALAVAAALAGVALLLLRLTPWLARRRRA